jgi:NADH-quinone oxidoreductase subunit C
MTKDELVAYIGANFADRLTPVPTGKREAWFEVKPEQLLEVASQLRDDANLKFDFLCNISGVDTGQQFQMVYSLTSTSLKHRIELKLVLPHDAPSVDSVQTIWPGANWHEREAWELFGIDIKDHGDLTRFLLPDEWDQGHPMRKDWTAPDFIRMPEL